MVAVRSIWVSVLLSGAVPAATEPHEFAAADWTTPLFATEMYARYSASLEQELVTAGRTPNEADYLVFRITADIARCATAILARSDDPSVGAYLRLLGEYDSYGPVIDELAARYSSSEFWNLMASIDEATGACFEKSFKDLGLTRPEAR